MTKKSQANWIFKKWSASLSEKDKKYDSISSNFDELFFDLSNCGIDFDTAEEFMNQAISAHSPSLSIIKRVYNRNTKIKNMSSFEEFRDNWVQSIKDKALNSFSNFFDIEEPVKEKNIGSMSKKEYAAARKYTESFPTIDPNSVPEINIEDMFDIKLEEL